MYLLPHVLLWCILGSHNLFCMLVCSHSYVAVKLTTCLQLVPRLRMCGPLLLCPHTSHLHAVVPRHRDFTFTLMIVWSQKPEMILAETLLSVADICDMHGIAIGYYNYFTLTVLFNLSAVLFTDWLALSHTTLQVFFLLNLISPNHYENALIIQTYSNFLKPDFLFLASIKITKILQFSRNLSFVQFI